MPETNTAPEIPEQEINAGADASEVKASKPTAKKPRSDTASAAKEVNDALKAMDPDLDASAVKQIEDDGMPTLLVDDAGDFESDISPISDELTEPLEAEQADELVAETESPDESSAETDTIEQEPEPTKSDVTEAPSLPDDPELDKVVDDIVASDGDAVLEAEDNQKGLATGAAAPVAKHKGKFRSWLSGIWSNPKSRFILITGILALILLAALVPYSRYFILNTAQIRASLQLRVVDGGTLQPLKNVTVRAGGAEAQTDSDGVAKLEKVRLGNTTLQIEKRAFSPIDRDITVGWGSNPLGEFQATAVGTQYTFFVKDFLSGKPIERAEATAGDGNASSDAEGKIVLTLDTAEQDDAAQVTVTISASNYRNEDINLTVNNRETQSVEMVPSRKHTFVSKRSGRYDVYTVHADGKNEQKIVSGTGLERDDITLVPHQKDDVAALVATRENTRNQSGYLLSTLYVLDTNEGDLVKIDQSEQIQIIGWSDTGRLIYVKIAAGASGADPKRHRLMSFDNNDFSAGKELASSNSFNDVIMAAGKVYYAPSNVFQENVEPGVFVINPDGSSPQQILNKEAYSLVRSDFETIDINTGGSSWYGYTLGSSDSAKASQAPSSQQGRIYSDNPSGKTSLWVDSRDGKGVLLSYDRTDKKDSTLVSRGGLKSPTYWLNDKYIIFRVNDSKETADYVFNTDGGDARRITDVTDSAGINRWFYY